MCKSTDLFQMKRETCAFVPLIGCPHTMKGSASRPHVRACAFDLHTCADPPHVGARGSDGRKLHIKTRSYSSGIGVRPNWWEKHTPTHIYTDSTTTHVCTYMCPAKAINAVVQNATPHSGPSLGDTMDTAEGRNISPFSLLHHDTSC